MIEFSYQRVSDNQCTVTFIKTEPDAIGWLTWDKAGGTIKNNKLGVLSLWAIIGLYELGDTPTREHICTAHRDDARFAIHKARYPAVTKIIPALFDASKCLIKYCRLKDAVIDGASCQQLFVTLREPTLLDIIGDPTAAEVAYSGIMLEWVENSLLPHTAPHDPDELHQLPNLYDVYKTRQPFRGKREAGTPEEQVLFTPDGEHIIVMSQDGEVVAFDATSLKEQWRHSTGMLFPTAHLGPNHTLIVREFSAPQTIELDTKTGQVLRADGAIPTHITYSPSRRWTVTWLEETSYREVLLQADDMPPVHIKQPSEIEHLVFLPDESQVLLGGTYDHVSLWDLTTQKQLKTFDIPDTRTFDLSASAAGKHVAISTGNQVDIRRITCGTTIHRFESSDYVYAPRWSPDGRWVVMAHVHGNNGYGGRFTVHRLAHDREINGS